MMPVKIIYATDRTGIELGLERAWMSSNMRLAQDWQRPQQVPTLSSAFKSFIEQAPRSTAFLMSLSVIALQMQMYIIIKC